MDPELKKMLGEIKSGLGEVPKLKAALEQVEEKLAGVPATIEARMKAVRSTAFGPGGHYRGVMGSEAEARGIGLIVAAQVLNKGWAKDAMKRDMPDVHAKAFDTTDGEALVPEQYVSTIVDLIESYGTFERNAMKWPMGGDRARYPKKTGRSIAVPMEESTAVAETKPTILTQALTARKWGVYTEIPKEIEEDAASALGELVAMDMAEAHALAIDTAGFLGENNADSNQITGVVPALINAAVVTGPTTTWAGFTMDNHLQVVSKLTGAGRASMGKGGPKWYCSAQYFWTVMVPLTLAAGGVTAAEIEGIRRPVFLGFPVEETPVLPAATAAGKMAAVFGNLRKGAVFGDRRAFSFKRSDDYKFGEDVVSLLSTRRYDINIHGAGTGTTPEVLAGLKTKAS